MQPRRVFCAAINLDEALEVRCKSRTRRRMFSPWTTIR